MCQNQICSEVNTESITISALSRWGTMVTIDPPRSVTSLLVTSSLVVGFNSESIFFQQLFTDKSIQNKNHNNHFENSSNFRFS